MCVCAWNVKECGLNFFGFKSSKMVGEFLCGPKIAGTFGSTFESRTLENRISSYLRLNAANCAEIGPRFVGKVRRTHRAQGTPGESKSEERSGPAERR